MPRIHLDVVWVICRKFELRCVTMTVTGIRRLRAGAQLLVEFIRHTLTSHHPAHLPVPVRLKNKTHPR